MTDLSGVTNSPAGTTQQTTSGSTASNGAAGSTATSATVNETAQGTTVTIVQRDGSKSEFTIPTMRPDGKGGWISTPSAGMNDFAKVQNRKYGMQLDADDFMQLLVAQLRYQDPSKPADTAAMMQQTASMAMVERVNELAGAAESMTKSSEALAESNAAVTQHLGALLAQQSLAAAIGLIGQEIEYDEAGADGGEPVSKTGVVESVKVGADGPIITVNGKDVPIADLTGVKRAGVDKPAEGASESGQGSGSGSEPTAPSGEPATP